MDEKSKVIIKKRIKPKFRFIRLPEVTRLASRLVGDHPIENEWIEIDEVRLFLSESTILFYTEKSLT
jgi:hypothetical protein